MSKQASKSSSSDGRSFAPLLESLGSGVAQEAAESRERTVPALLSVLALLAGSGPVEVPALQARAGLDFSTFATILDALKQPGLVEVSGPPGNETVAITSNGRTLLLASSSKG